MKITSLSLVLSAYSLVCFAQQTPVFTSQSALVVVPVHVTDSQGAAVRDLSRQDFLLSDSGKLQPIVSFDPPVQNDSPPLPATPPGAFKNFDDDSTNRGLTIIALDPLNTQPADQVLANRAVTSFLQSRDSSSGPIALVYFHGGNVYFLHPVTRNSEALAAALQRARLPHDLNYVIPLDTSRYPSNDALSRKIKEQAEAMEKDQQAAAERESAHYTASSFREIAKILAAVPGEKILVWMTGGFRFRGQFPVLSDSYQSPGQWQGTANDQWARAFRALNNASVSVYPVDARGLVAPAEISDKSDVERNSARRPGEKIRIEAQSRQEFLTSLTWVANQTGGKALFNSNDLSRAVKTASDKSASSYLLAFVLPAPATRGWHRLDVKVIRAGLSISARSGFWVDGPKKRRKEDPLAVASRSPFPERGIPLIVRWEEAGPMIDKKKAAQFVVSIPPGSILAGESAPTQLALDVFAVATDEYHKVAATLHRRVDVALDAQSLARLAHSGFTYRAAVELAPGRYQVKFVVRDNQSGRLGGVFAPLEVRVD